MIHASHTFKLLTVLLCLNLSTFFGCTEKSDNMLVPPEETESISTPDGVPVANLEERTFSRLSAAYPRPLSDESFKTLRALANSAIYLEFLSRAFKPAKPFQIFDEFLETVPPDAEQPLRSILKQHLKHVVIDDKDITVLHQVLTIEQGINIISSTQGDFSLPPQLQNAMDRAYGTETFHQWFRPLANQPQQRQAFWKTCIEFAESANEAARKKLQELFDEHGQNNGIIWFAIQEPTIFWVILNTFTEPFGTADFLDWINLERREN